MLDIYLFEPDKVHKEKLREICTAYSIKHNTEQQFCAFEDVPDRVGTEECSSETSLYMIRGDKNLPHLAASILDINPENYTVLIAEDPGEIMRYISARFRPSGVLIKPAEYGETERIFDDICADYKRSEETAGRFRFKIRSREYSMNVDSILFFEAADKKVILRTAGQAFEFYMSMEQIIAGLPEWFTRIHKSYIVNTRHIAVVDHKNMTVVMDDNSRIYISRTYKENLHTVMKGSEK